jgi:hypothetical protein
MNTDYFLNMHWKLWIDNGVFHVKAVTDKLDLFIVQSG